MNGPYWLCKLGSGLLGWPLEYAVGYLPPEFGWHHNKRRATRIPIGSQTETCWPADVAPHIRPWPHWLNYECIEVSNCSDHPTEKIAACSRAELMPAVNRSTGLAGQSVDPILSRTSSDGFAKFCTTITQTARNSTTPPTIPTTTRQPRFSPVISLIRSFIRVPPCNEVWRLCQEDQANAGRKGTWIRHVL